MTLALGFQSVRDLAEKLERDATEMREQGVSADRLFDFVLTAYSMIDWVRNDAKLPDSARRQGAIDGLYADRWLKICGDLATAAKHFTLTSRKPIVSGTTTAQGFGIGRFGMGAFGTGEQVIQIEIEGAGLLDALDLVDGAIESWKNFRRTHGI
jgi:hypothetical protein